MSEYDGLPKPFFVLAPMDDVTDTVFRQTIASCAKPHLFFTEFVNVDGLQSPGRPKLLKKLLFTSGEAPLIAQIWGKYPENFYKTAQELANGTFASELGLPTGVNFAGIDINMGCPDKTVVKNGACSALINNRDLAHEIIVAVQEGSNGALPVSVKTRLGFSTIDYSWHEFLLTHNLAMLTVHARTRKEMSKVPARWENLEYIRLLRDRISPKTLLVGNGDIESRQQGIDLAKQFLLDGIMIGRGIFHDPYIFAADSSWLSKTPRERIELYRQHIKLFRDTWRSGERAIATLNKFCKVYVNDFRDAKELRESLMRADTIDDLLNKLNMAAESSASELRKNV